MDDALLVRIAERASNCLHYRNHIRNRELTFSLESLAERFPLDVGHSVIEGAPGLTGVVQRKDVRVVEPGGDFDLT